MQIERSETNLLCKSCRIHTQQIGHFIPGHVQGFEILPKVLGLCDFISSASSGLYVHPGAISNSLLSFDSTLKRRLRCAIRSSTVCTRIERALRNLLQACLVIYPRFLLSYVKCWKHLCVDMLIQVRKNVWNIWICQSIHQGSCEAGIKQLSLLQTNWKWKQPRCYFVKLQ